MVIGKGSTRSWYYREDYWPRAGEISAAVNAIGTQLGDPINSGCGTDPMAYDGINKWTPPRKSGGIPLVSTRFSLSVESGQADAGRDDRTRLARPNSQEERTGTGKYEFSLFS